MKRLYGHNRRGFTLVEAIISIAILTAAISGPLFLAYQGIKSSRDAKQELIATHLAAEGLEIIESMRDNILADLPYASGPSSNLTSWIADVVARCSGNGCVADIIDQANLGNNPSPGHQGNMWRINQNNKSLSSCNNPGPNCSKSQVYQYTATDNVHIYRQNAGNNNLNASWATTPYKRVIRVEYIDQNGQITGSATREAVATSTVYFTRENGSQGTVVLSENLYNWFPPL